MAEVQDATPEVSEQIPAAIERTPPHNFDAEQGLIASCLIDGGQDTLAACQEIHLNSDAFYDPKHRVIYEVMCDLFTDGKGVDEIALIDRLRGRTTDSIDWLARKRKMQRLKPVSLLDYIEGPGAVVKITDRIETAAHAEHWLKIVREKWILRRMVEACTRVIRAAYDNPEEVAHFLDDAERQILSINEARIQDEAQSIEQAVETASNLINQILQGKTDHGVMTGFTDIDNMTFGLHPGQMIVLAARPSMGKTSLGMNIAEHVALPRRGEALPVLVFSLEMPADQLAMRMLCGRAAVNMKRVRDRMVSKEQMKELGKVAKQLRNAPIWIDDASHSNINEIRAKARRITRQQGVRLIVIDYLQLISGTDPRVPREQQIAEISRGIKAISKELSVPVLVLSQLNRASEKENRQPRLSDLRESGSIEQDADVVFLLASRQKEGDNPTVPQASRERELIIAKQRNGPTGSVSLTFIPDFTRFENYTRQPSPNEDG